MENELKYSDSKLKELIDKNKILLLKSNVSSNDLLNYLADKINKVQKSGLVVIQLIGGAASGKTTLAAKLCKKLGEADFFSTDDFLIKDREFRRKNIEGNDPTLKYDRQFLNSKILEISNLKEGNFTGVPTYNEMTGIAIDEGDENYKHKIGKIKYLIVEGDFNFVDNCDLNIYFHVSDEIRLKNRIERDRLKRNASVNEITENFSLRQKLQHVPYTLKIMEVADVITSARKNESRDYIYDIYEKVK